MYDPAAHRMSMCRTLATVVRTPALVDARNVLDPVAWRAAGWTLCAPGRPRLG